MPPISVDHGGENNVLYSCSLIYLYVIDWSTKMLQRAVELPTNMLPVSVDHGWEIYMRQHAKDCLQKTPEITAHG